MSRPRVVNLRKYGMYVLCNCCPLDNVLSAVARVTLKEAAYGVCMYTLS